MGLDRHTVSKYRQIKEAAQQQATDLLSGKEEQMWLKKKLGEMPPEPKLSKEEKKKLDLLAHYSPKDIQEMLNYIAQNNKREIDEVL